MEQYPDLVEVASQGGGATECPRCHGGRTREQKCYVFKGSDSRWWFKCHRASCGFAGPLDGTAYIPDDKPATVKVYTGKVERLPLEHVGHLDTKHPLLLEGDAQYFNHVLKWNPDRNTLLIPFRSGGKLAGYVERAAKPGEDSPFDPYTHCGPSWKDKAKTWFESEAQKGSLAWYGKPRSRVVVVEDCLSAICGHLAEGGTWVALIGTGLNTQKVSELYRGGCDDLRIALDKDATGQAFALAKKWGMGFNSCRVIPLEKDVKDMTLDEFNDMRWD